MKGFIVICFWLSIALFAIALGLAVFGIFGLRDDPDRAAGLGVSAVTVWVVSLLFLGFASFTSVGTKNVAVLTSFGRPSGAIGNGFHFKAPWKVSNELTDAVQTDTYASDGGAGGKQQGGATGSCVGVRIARQGTACVNVSVRWQIKESGVDYLFRNYANNGAITDNLVLRDLQAAMNVAFSNYDPLGIDSNGLSTNKPLTQLASDVTTELRNELGSWIDVQTTNIPILNFDSATQDKINQLQQQVAATRVAQQALQTATAQAAANQALAASVGNDPNVLTDKCLNILKEAVDKGQALPAGFSCFGATSTAVAVGK